MKNILPAWLYLAISKEFPDDCIYELRVRLNKPLIINYKGRDYNLRLNNGLRNDVYTVDENLISYIISVATKQSLYAYAEQIQKGYISTDNGVRIGLCGTAVYNNESITMFKKITSLNVRIGHNIYGCSCDIVKNIVGENGVYNTLIISPPGAGKTTMLRDIVVKFSSDKCIKNILVIDERFEISGLNQEFDLGENVDVISGTTKYFAFKECLKVMNPSVIVTDEISEECDLESIKLAAKSGVRVIATAHANDITELKSKKYFKCLLEDGYFERVVVLSKRNGVGTVEGIFDNNSKLIAVPYLI